MPPRDRRPQQQPKKAALPVTNINDESKTSDPTPGEPGDPNVRANMDPGDPANIIPDQEGTQEATGEPQTAPETFVAHDDLPDGVSPLAAPQRATVPQRTYENKPSAGGGNARPVGRILQGKEPLTFEGIRDGDNVMLTENVYREVYYPGTKRPSFILVATRGQVMKAARLTNLTERKDGVA